MDATINGISESFYIFTCFVVFRDIPLMWQICSLVIWIRYRSTNITLDNNTRQKGPPFFMRGFYKTTYTTSARSASGCCSFDFTSLDGNPSNWPRLRIFPLRGTAPPVSPRHRNIMGNRSPSEKQEIGDRSTPDAFYIYGYIYPFGGAIIITLEPQVLRLP